MAAKGEITVREAGRCGGTSAKKEYGPEFSKVRLDGMDPGLPAV